MKINLVCRFILLLMLLGLSSCATTQYPQAQQGILDLSHENLPENFVITLGGEWEFYWDKLYKPQDFTAQNFEKKYISVPGSWTSKTNKNGKNYPSEGRATYRLRVILPKNTHQVDILMPSIWTAERTWINQRRIAPRGNQFLTPDSLQQAILGMTQTIQTLDNQVEIVVQVGNQNFFIAGLVQNFKLGGKGELIKQKNLTNVRQLMGLGVLYAMSLYHFILYFFRKSNKSTLYFGIICFLIGLRLSIFGEHYIYEYLHLHSGFFTTGIQVKTYYLSNALLVPFGLLYVHRLYPQEATLKIGNFLYRVLKSLGFRNFANKYENELQKILLIHISILILGSYAFIGILMPFGIFTKILIPMQVFVFGFAAYLVFILIKSAIHKRRESRLQLLGIFTVVFAGVNEALHSMGFEIVGELELLPFAFGIFLSLQFLIIAKRFSRAFSEVEDLSANLERKVIERTAEVTQQKEELEIQGELLLEQNVTLEKTNKHITDSVRYARRIQRAVLGSEDLISEQFREAFVMLLPKDIVSGDFYFYDCKNEMQVLVAADCTGHGVPGAFMTIMGHNFLEEIITHGNITDPAQILYQLNRRVMLSLQKSGRETANDGMDASILAIHTPTQTLHYAGAKNPLYRVCVNGEMHQYKGSRSTIGGSSRLQDKKSFVTTTIQYQPSEVFYIFSDGFQDQFGGTAGRKYLTANFRKFLLQISPLPMDKQKRKLRRELQQWQEYRPQTDDILVIGIRL